MLRDFKIVTRHLLNSLKKPYWNSNQPKQVYLETWFERNTEEHHDQARGGTRVETH